MREPMEKKVFPGGNTSLGFFSYYNYIIPPEKAARIIVLKGGPGVGKSSFMGWLGKKMLNEGYDVELHYCSSDNNSLDAVVFPQIGVALIDGTAPHIVDPRFPGAVDEILHLGDYWREENLRRNRDSIITLTQTIGGLFRSAYRYLAAAKSVHDNWEAVITPVQDFGWVNQITNRLAATILGGQRVCATPGRERHLFGAAFTPQGPTEHFDSLLDPIEKKIVLKGSPGTGKSTLLSKIGKMASERGCDVEYYHNPLVPDKIDHIIIPGLNTTVATSGEVFSYEAPDILQIINLDDGLNREAVARFAGEIEEDKTHFFRLLNRAIGFIAQAKREHDKLEELYVPNMDFESINQVRERVLERILGYARESTAAK